MTRQLSVFALSALMLVAFSTGCKKKTKTTTSGDAVDTVAAEDRNTADGEDLAVAEGLPDPNGIETMTLERVHFEFDQAILTASAKDILSRNADILRANPTVKIRLEGHCDSRGSTQYNLALGERRAAAVREFLVNLGVPSGNLVIVSLGEEKPLNPAEAESAFTENRRAESVVIEGSDAVLGSAK